METKNCEYLYKNYKNVQQEEEEWTYTIKDFQLSDKFDNPYLMIPWVANDNSEQL